MNFFNFGSKRQLILPKGSFLFIDDEVPPHPKAKVFDPQKSRFNPLKDVDKKTTRDIAKALYSGPHGESTLTVRNGRRALAQALAGAPRFDKIEVESSIKGVKEEVDGMTEDILFTDVMRQVLCTDDDFAFTGRNTKVFARLNRAELGEDDALFSVIY